MIGLIQAPLGFCLMHLANGITNRRICPMIGLMQPLQGVLPNSLGKAKFAVCEFRPMIGLTAPLPLFTSTRFAQRIRQKHTRHIFPLREGLLQQISSSGGVFATDFVFGGDFATYFLFEGSFCHRFRLRGKLLPPISSSGGGFCHIFPPTKEMRKRKRPRREHRKTLPGLTIR